MTITQAERAKKVKKEGPNRICGNRFDPLSLLVFRFNLDKIAPVISVL
jgi:hypothetical protein